MVTQPMGNPKNIGRYEILEELGHGALGIAHRAKNVGMERIVALKATNSLVL
jgi:serine/threonine protein kinase